MGPYLRRLRTLSKTSVPFSSLPVEVQLNIMEHLDAKTIQRLPQVRNAMKAIVDGHQLYLALKIAKREQLRILRFGSYHDYSKLSLLEALSRWVAQKGVWSDREHFFHSLSLFVKHYMHNRDPSTVFWATDFDLTMLAGGLLSLHAYAHMFTDGTYFYTTTIDQFLSRWRKPGNDINEDVFRTLHQEVTGNPERLNFKVHARGKPYRDGLPPRLITELEDYNAHCTLGTYSSSDFDSLIGTPSTFQTGAFAYYVEEDIALNIVTLAMQLSSDSERSKRPLLCAAMWEVLRAW